MIIFHHFFLRILNYKKKTAFRPYFFEDKITGNRIERWSFLSLQIRSNIHTFYLWTKKEHLRTSSHPDLENMVEKYPITLPTPRTLTPMLISSPILITIIRIDLISRKDFPSTKLSCAKSTLKKDTAHTDGSVNLHTVPKNFRMIKYAQQPQTSEPKDVAPSGRKDFALTEFDVILVTFNNHLHKDLTT